MKLKEANLPQLPAPIARPDYCLAEVTTGIAHIGVGGFHRAHQAAYTDALMNTGEGLEWGICGIGTRAEERSMRDALASQDYLYTLVELDDRPDTEVRVIGSIRDMLLVDEDGSEAVVARLADPAIRIVSLTITEGGYCLDDRTMSAPSSAARSASRSSSAALRPTSGLAPAPRPLVMPPPI